MDLVLHVTRFNLRAYLRNRKARMFTIVIPLILLALLAGVFHGGETTVSGVKIDYRQFFVPSVIVFSLTLTTLAMLVATVVSQRELGITKRRRATPLPAWALIVSQSLTVVVMAIGTVILLLAVGAIAFGVHFPLRGLPTLVLGGLGGAAPFCGLGAADDPAGHLPALLHFRDLGAALRTARVAAGDREDLPGRARRRPRA